MRRRIKSSFFLTLKQGVIGRMVLVVMLFRVFELNLFCFVVAICDLVQNVQAIFHLP